MKRIINGKAYNTDTAEEVAEYWNGYSVSDFKHFTEALYKTSKGAWFIAGEGGPMSHYARSVPGGTGGGEGLRVVTEAEAMAWLEGHGFTDELEEYFGDRIEEA